MPQPLVDENIFGLYQDPSFANAKPQERADFLGQYFDRTVAPKLSRLDGVNLDDSRARFIKAHTLGADFDADVAGLYASSPDFAQADPRRRADFLGRYFDRKIGADAQYVDKSALTDARDAYIARNLTQEDRHSLFGVGSFAKDFVRDLPQGVLTTLSRAARQMASTGVVPMEPEMQLEEKPNFIRADGSGFVDRQVAAQNRADQVSELRYGDNPIVGHGSFLDPLGAKASSGYSMSSSVPSAALGMGFGPLGAAAGAALAGPVIHFSIKDQFLTDAVQKANDAMLRQNGRRLTQDEVDTLVGRLDAAATKYGAWEAIPEMASDAIFGSMLGGGLKNILKGTGVAGRVGRAVLGGAVDLASEHSSETVSQYGQGGVEAENGLRESAPTWGEAFNEQFPVTNAQLLMSHGSAALIGKALKPGLVRGAEKLGVLNPTAPGEHRDLLAESGAESDADAAPVRDVGGYSVDAVNKAYQEEHSAAFPTVAELMRQQQPDVRGPLSAAPERGYGLGRTEYADVPGYAEDDVRRRYEDGHAAPFPTAAALSPQGWTGAEPQAVSAGFGLGVPETARPEARPFSPAEPAAPAPERQTQPQVLAAAQAPAPVQVQPPKQPQVQPDRRRDDTLIEQGEVVRSQSGRELAPFPRVETGTDRKIKNTMQRVDAWLVDEARMEVQGDDYRETLVSALDPKRLSPADRTMLNTMLFGEGGTPGRIAQGQLAAAPEGRRVLRADGRPFPTKRAAESHAELLRRTGQFATVMPESAGGFSVETRGRFEDSQMGQDVRQAVEDRDAKRLWGLLRLDTNKNARGLFHRLTNTPAAKTQRDLRAAIDAWTNGVEAAPNTLPEAATPMPSEQIPPAGSAAPTTNAPQQTQGQGIPAERQAENAADNARLREQERPVAHIVRRAMPNGERMLEAYDDNGRLLVSKPAGAKGRPIEGVVLADGHQPGNRRRKFDVSADWKFSREYFEGGQPATPGADPETRPEPEARTGLPQGVHRIAAGVMSALQEGRKITWRDLQRMADEGFGGTQAEGKWTMKEAYDAMEMGVNAQIRHGWLADGRPLNPGTADAAQMKGIVSKLQKRVLDLLPTQTRRSEEQMEFQQFSTPPTLAAVAVWAGRPRKGEVMLEPSAGVGGISVFAHNAGAEVHMNELDPRRRAMLEHMGYGAVTGENAEQLHNILPGDVRPTLIVMNPPFSSTAGRKRGERKTANATRHLDQALARLEPGGRLVAILSQGMSADKAFMSKWWSKVRENNTLRANIRMDGAIYKKYGTNFDNLLVVIDKTPPTGDAYVNVACKTLDEAIDALSEVRDARIAPAEPGAPEQRGEEGLAEDRHDAVPAEPVRPATGALGPGERQSEGGGLPAGGLRGSAALPGDTGVGHAGDSGTGGPGKHGRRDPGGLQPGHEPDAVGGGDSGEHLNEPDDPESRLPGRGPAEHSAQLEIEPTAPEKASAPITDSLFEPYRPQRIRVKGAKPHPSPLVQSAAMAAVEPPAVHYAPKLARGVVESGALSEAQLEQVIYAGQAHSETLPDGSRRGYFIGDGTGVGKGREIAGIIMDNWNHGRKKAVWVTFNGSLFADAGRDMRGIGFDSGKLFKLGDTKMDESVKRDEGVMFTTYATLPQLPKGAGKAGREAFSGGRMDQIVAWLGENFDGVVALDESHKMGNALETKGERGKKAPSQQALAGVELQRRLPNARVVYVSATGATEPENLSYLERLGLWGEGTTFNDKRGLVDAITAGGVAAMELVSRDIKAMGGYLARTLSYDGVTYSRLEHKLTEYQRKAYDTYARAWQIVLDNINDALEETGQGKNREAKSSALSLFWGNHQRFFGQVLTSMTMPSVLADIKKELADGNSCVVQLTNTNEAAQERALQEAAKTGGDLASLDITPRQMLMDYVRRGFPTHQFEEYLDGDGNSLTRLVTDAGGSPVENREAARRRDMLLERLGALKVPGNPLDMIVEEIGPGLVAEVTGRSRRVVNGREERRGPATGAKEAQDFMDGKRRVLVFSQAGGTGRSYHADREAKNQQKRIHYILQPGWRADAATQGLGRTHRSNEALPPHYKLVTTDLRGHKRFTSSIARRLDQLGALTQGQRQTGSQGLFSASDNLENNLAHSAWVWLAGDIYSGHVEGVSYKDFVAQTALTLEKKDESGVMAFTPPPIKQFLNRLLSMTVDFQNRVFAGFEERLRNVYANAEERGDLDRGVETLKAERVDVDGEETLHTDQRSGAETRALALKVHIRRKLQNFDQLVRGYGEPEGWWRNRTSGRVYAGYAGGIRQDEAGRLVERVLLRTVREDDLHRRPSLEELHENYERVDGKTAHAAWEKTYAEAPKTEVEDKWLLTGMLLPVWNHISGAANVYRLQDSQGRRHLGRLLDRDQYNQTRKNLGLGVDLPKYTPKQALEAVLKGRKLTLRDGYVLEARRVSGETRVEITGEPVAWNMDSLKKHGAFSEIIGYKTRLFAPTGEKGVAFMERMLPLHPLVDEERGMARMDEPAPHFSVRQAERGEEAMSANVVRGALQNLQARAKNARPLEVVQSFEDLPKHIRRKARRNGNTVIEGVYDPRGEKVWLVAEGLPSRKRAVEVWMHEQCSHRGLRGLFGDDRRFAQFLRGVFESAGGKSVFREIAADYAFDLATPADQLRAAEEYLSRLMEKVRAEEVLSAPETRVWRKVVRFVKEMLNALGARVSFTDEEIASFLRDAVYWTFEGREAAKDPSLAHDLAEWSRQLREREDGGLTPRAVLRLGRTPDVLLKLGVPDLPMVMFQGKLSRIEADHGITATELERLPALLDAPLAVLDSATEAGTYVAVLNMRDAQGRQLKAAIHPDVTAGCVKVNLVASVYGQQGIRNWMDEQAHWGRVRYLDKKKGSPRLDHRSRLQLPGVAKAGSAEVNRKLLTDMDVVKRDPDVRFSIAPRGTNAALDSAMDKIGAPRTTVAERVRGLGEQFKAEFEQGMFDRFASLREVDKNADATKAEDSAYIAARMTTSLGDVMTAIVKHGAPVWRQGAVDVDAAHQGFASLFAPVTGEVDRWCAWMVGKRAEKLAAEGRENLFTPEEIQALKGLNAGREVVFDKVWRDYTRFKGKVLDFAQEAGVIDPGGRALWDHDEYIPFYRLMEEGKIKGPRDKAGIASQTSGIRTLKGGESNLGDPFENIVRNFTHLVDAAVKNHAMDLAMRNAEATGVAHRMDLRGEAVKLPAGAMQAALRKVFGDKRAVWTMSEAQRASLQTVFHLTRPSGKDVVHVLRGGRPEYYQVSDPLLLRALTAMNQSAIGGWAMQGMRFFKRLLTRGVTSTPEFMVRNLVRDTLSAWAVDNSGSFKPVLGSLRGLAKTLREDEDTVHMLAAGASFQGGYALGHDPAAARLLVDRLMSKHGISQSSVLNTPQKLGRFLKSGWEWWEEKGQAVENSTRADIYSQMRARGATHLEAAYEAKNIMDYSMRGDWPAVRFLCETVPFFGARLTGLHRLARGYQTNRRAFLIKGAMVTLASVALFLANRQEPEYQELEEFDRDNYYHFFVSGGHYRLPKPFEIGALFGTLPERLTQQFVDDEATGRLFAERMGYMLTQTFNVGFPQIGAPLVEEYANRSFFTDRPIVSRRLERLRPGDQREPWTGETVSLAAKTLDDSGVPLPEALRSPKRLEHLANAYFGTLGMYVLGAADMVTRWATDAPDRPEARTSDLPILRSFYRDGPARNTRQAGELYDMLHDVETTYATVMELRRTGDMDRAKELAEKNNSMLALRRGTAWVEKRLAEFDKANRQITMDAALGAEEKRRRLDDLAEKRNVFVRRVHDKLQERMREQGAGRAGV